MISTAIALLPSESCVDALIAASGNISLAAERLGVTTQTLIASIAADPTAQDSLNIQLRTLATLNTYDTMRQAKVLLDASLTDMEPEALGKFYTSLLNQVTALTDDHTTTSNVNIHEYVMKHLTPEARNALMDIVTRPTNPTSYDALTAPGDADADADEAA